MVHFTGIPISHYFDSGVYAKEKLALFKNQPIYLGATGMLQNEGDFRVVEREFGSKILTLKNSKITLLDNICAHRQAKMLKGSGNSSSINCPFHRWSYEPDTGHCINAPMCKNDKNEKKINTSPLIQWKNLLFSSPKGIVDSFESFNLLSEMQIDKMVYKKTVCENLNYNWKHYIDIFGENYHIPFIHPGFNFFLDLNSMDWFEHENFHGQMVKPKPIEYLKKHKTTPVYRRWLDLLLDYYQDQLPNYAGILLMVYPNIMIECYPLYMTICTVHPTGPETSIMYCDYFHHEDVMSARPDIVEAAENASAETMFEDNEICDRTAEGRKFLFEQNRDAESFYQSPLEDGLAMFHRYYQRKMHPFMNNRAQLLESAEILNPV